MNKMNWGSRPTLRSFLILLYSNTKSLLLGGFSILFTALALFLPMVRLRFVFLALAILSIVSGAFQAWKSERLKVIKAETEANNLNLDLVRCNQSLSQSTKQLHTAGQEIKFLEAENERLRKRPYDEQQKKYVQERIRILSSIERDILRFLIIHGGESNGNVLTKALRGMGGFPQSELYLLQDLGLLKIHLDRLNGIAEFTVNAPLRNVLEDILWPRKENVSPGYFIGLD